MEKEFGIQETKDVLSFALTFGNSLGAALKDGKISLAELPGFLPAVVKLPAAISGIQEIPSEISHLSDEEKAELFEFVKDEFDIENDKIEGAVLDGLKLVSGLYDYVQKYFIQA